MTLLPIIARELRVKARGGRLRRGRVFMAAVALLVVFWLLLLPEWTGAYFPPQLAFMASFGVAFWVAWFTGAQLTTDSFSREYREGTLRLLFLSHLRGWEIALGKLASNTITAACLLLATVPMLCLPVLLGAAPAGVVLRLSVSLVNALIFSAALGLLFSSQTDSGRRARNFAMLLLVLMLFGTPFLAQAARLPLGGKWVAWLLWFSPAWTHTAAAKGWMGAFGAPGGLPDFWPAVAAQQGVALLMTLLAGFIAARRSVERPAGRLRLGWRERWRLWRLGKPATRRARRRQLLDQNPFLWLICRYRFRPVWPLVLVTVPLAGLLGLHLIFPEVMEWRVALVFAAVLMHLLLRFHLAAESVAPLLTERLGGTLPLLLVTPLRNRDFLRGQWQAMIQQFAPALGLTLLATLSLINVALSSSDPSSWWAPILACLWLLADFWTLTWVGMWCATWRNNPRRAAGNAGFIVLVFPWLVLLLGSLAWGFAEAFLIPPALLAPLPLIVKEYLPLLIWIAIFAGNDAFWTLLSRRILRARLRQWASRPLAPESE